MRLVAAPALLFALAGCPISSSGGECVADRDCDDEVCARDMICTDPSDVREVQTTWTIRGAAASTTSCGTNEDLFISFIGRDFGDTLGFAPVPCRVGQFFVDKLPSRFRQVELGVDGGPTQTRTISGSGTIVFDLPL